MADGLVEEIVSHSVEETIAFGTYCAYELGMTHILLNGDLGAGKTHFVQGFFAGIQQKHGYTDTSASVQSPTYSYVHHYPHDMYHFDLYRLGSAEDFVQKGLCDSIFDAQYCLIERPKFSNMYADKTRYVINIAIIDLVSRQIERSHRSSDNGLYA